MVLQEQVMPRYWLRCQVTICWIWRPVSPAVCNSQRGSSRSTEALNPTLKHLKKNKAPNQCARIDIRPDQLTVVRSTTTQLVFWKHARSQMVDRYSLPTKENTQFLMDFKKRKKKFLFNQPVLIFQLAESFPASRTQAKTGRRWPLHNTSWRWIGSTGTRAAEVVFFFAPFSFLRHPYNKWSRVNQNSTKTSQDSGALRHEWPVLWVLASDRKKRSESDLEVVCSGTWADMPLQASGQLD